jgi:hypothetical protein
MRQSPRWSKPYYGVTHLLIPRIYATVTDYGAFAEAYWLWKPTGSKHGLKFYEHSGYKATVVDERMFYASKDEHYLDSAKTWLENKTKGIENAST